MTKIVFITSGQIDYKFSGIDLYESIYLTANGTKFPDIDKKGIPEIIAKAKKMEDKLFACIYTAPSKQCLSTAKIISKELGIKFKRDSNLVPLKFELKKLISKREFQKLGDKKFDVLRKRYLAAFYSNQLSEPNTIIKTRSKNFIKRVKEEYPEQTILVVSHAYTIKLLSIYQKIGIKMFRDKKLLFKLFKPENEPMKRLEEITFVAI